MNNQTKGEKVKDELEKELREAKDEIETLSKELCEMEDWLLGTRQRLKERIRDLIALEGEIGDIRAENGELRSLLLSLHTKTYTGYDFNADPDKVSLKVGRLLYGRAITIASTSE
jgi:septal ring factor EnvC (AmiA/AmiB activator)